MENCSLALPNRESKPRSTGWTILIDSGVPLRHFEDVILSAADYIDIVKFGWGTSVVTKFLEEKTEFLRNNQIGYYFGGTLFEKYALQDKVNDYYQLCLDYGCTYVEISNGTIAMSNSDKARYITEFSHEFTVLSEVGYKDEAQSIRLHPAKWIEYIQEDLDAGAAKVITEARESGTSGICRSNGELRYGLIEEIMASPLDTDRIIFEAPTKSLQTYFIKELGADVNLANIAFEDAIGLETLRLGLRSDTLLYFEERTDTYERRS